MSISGKKSANKKVRGNALRKQPSQQRSRDNDAAALSIATESAKRAKLKEKFLLDSVHDLFARYV